MITSGTGLPVGCVVAWVVLDQAGNADSPSPRIFASFASTPGRSAIVKRR